MFSKVLKLANDPTGLQLTEGVKPTAQQFQMIRLEQTVDQYGGYAEVTDRLTDESINDITSEFNMRIAEQGGETMNLVVRNALLGGSNVRYANAAADRDAITAAGVYTGDFDYMLQSFKAEKVSPISMLTKGSTNVGTSPIREAYPAIVPVESMALLEALDDSNGNTFQSVEEYAGQIATWPGEYGRYKNFRFIVNTEVAFEENTAGTPQNVAQALVFGKGAYHYTNIAGSDVEVIIKSLGSAGTADPLNQISTIGWKAKKTAVIVQPTYMFRYEFSVGAA